MELRSSDFGGATWTAQAKRNVFHPLRRNKFRRDEHVESRDADRSARVAEKHRSAEF